ncbi:MAG: hypothetical protein Q8P02_03305 [Candidatus Micrarchaeota archaeon]|nr:hypothetical protein [Candidatus Micrarchaeota archaeon]
MPLKRLNRYTAFYRIAHRRRVQLFNWKWRVIVALLAVAAMTVIYEYLQYRYPIYFPDVLRGIEVKLSERIFEWFGIGVLFGATAMSLLYEGEFILSIRRTTKEFEESVRAMVGMAGKAVGLNAAHSKKPRARKGRRRA